MSDMLSRRKLIRTGLAAAAGVSGLGVAAALPTATVSSHPTMAASTAWAKP